jgi:hypothetical protein
MGLALAQMASTARGEDLTVVHLVGLDMEKSNPRDVPATFDRVLPAGQDFIVEIAAPGTYDVNGRLRVWPNLGSISGDQKGCGQPMPGTDRQVYELGLAITGKEGDRTLRAVVPRLQVGQNYFFEVRIDRGMPDADFDRVAINASDMAITAIVADPTLCGKREVFDRALTSSMAPGESSRRPSEAAFIQFSSGRGGDLCAAYINAWAKQEVAARGKPKRDVDDLLVKAVDATSAAVRAEIVAAITSDRVHHTLAISLAEVPIKPGPIDGPTTNSANYVSIDIGAALAFPSGSREVEPWLVPYAGLNVYFVPVDRDLKLSQLVGPTRLQRLSLTLGFTLSVPSLTGRTVDSPFADRLPLMALGLRFSQYGRLSFGAIGYWLKDLNPASGGKNFEVAPFVAISGDLDVVHLLTGAQP